MFLWKWSWEEGREDLPEMNSLDSDWTNPYPLEKTLRRLPDEGFGALIAETGWVSEGRGTWADGGPRNL